MSVAGVRWRDIISVLSFVALLASFPFGWMQVTDNSWQIDEDLTVVTAGDTGGGGVPQGPPTIKGTQIQVFNMPLLSIVVGIFVFFLILLAIRYFRGVESVEVFGRRFSFDWVLALVVYVLYYVVTNAGPGYGQLESLNLRAAGVVAHNSMGIATLAYIGPGVREWWKRRNDEAAADEGPRTDLSPVIRDALPDGRPDVAVVTQSLAAVDTESVAAFVTEADEVVALRVTSDQRGCVVGYDEEFGYWIDVTTVDDLTPADVDTLDEAADSWLDAHYPDATIDKRTRISTPTS